MSNALQDVVDEALALGVNTVYREGDQIWFVMTFRGSDAAKVAGPMSIATAREFAASAPVAGDPDGRQLIDALHDVV